MASMQCHKPCEQTSYKLQKSHSADKCHDKHQTGHNYGHMSSHTTHDKHQTGHNGHMMSTHSTTHHDKCHQTGGHGHAGHGQMTLTNKVKEAVHSATKILHHDGSHKATGHCSTGTTAGHIGHMKPIKSRQEGKNGHCMPKVRNMKKKKKNHKGNKNSDCSDSDSGSSSSSSSSDSESDCEKPKRKNC